jgi:HEAT repeat protein
VVLRLVVAIWTLGVVIVECSRPSAPGPRPDRRGPTARATPGSMAPVPEEQPCVGVAACVATLEAVAPGWDLDDPREAHPLRLRGIQPVLDGLRPHGEAAARALLPLLRRYSHNVRESAALALAHLDVPLTRFVSELAAAADRRVFWAVVALGRTASPDAVPTLLRAVRRTYSTEWACDALRNVTPQFIPLLVEALSRPGFPGGARRRLVDWVRDTDRGKARMSGPGHEASLLTLALDPARPVPVRAAAVEVLGEVGPRLPLDEHQSWLELRVLAEHPDWRLRDAARHALRLLGDPRWPTPWVWLASPEEPLRTAAEHRLVRLGPGDRAELPQLLAILDRAHHRHWGDLGYTVADALGALGDRRAVPALAVVERGSCRPERIRAREARLAIEGTRAPGSPWPRPGEVFCHDLLDDSKRCASGYVYGGRRIELGPSRERPRLGPIYSALGLPHGTRVLVEVPGGYLAGADRGEWGGGLFFVGLDGEEHRLGPETVLAIIPVGSAWTVLARDFGGGRVLRVRSTDGDRWAVQLVAELPGEPAGWRLEANGTLLVAGGSWAVTLQPGRPMQSLSCLAARP